jgi:hypothetical protein
MLISQKTKNFRDRLSTLRQSTDFVIRDMKRLFPIGENVMVHVHAAGVTGYIPGRIDCYVSDILGGVGVKILAEVIALHPDYERQLSLHRTSKTDIYLLAWNDIELCSDARTVYTVANTK